MQEQDYIERLIAQIATAIARMVGIARDVGPDEAERELGSTWSRTIGLRRADLERLDAGTLRSLLGGKRIAAAMLLDAEADLEKTRGHDDKAAALTSLAEQLRS